MGKNKLKPCKHCGSTDVYKERDITLPFNRVVCNSCGSMTGVYDDMRYAVKAWNEGVYAEDVYK